MFAACLSSCHTTNRAQPCDVSWTKSSTSVAFNYRASCRARSHAEFTSKIGLVAEEADETQDWLEFIEAGELIASPELTRLLNEATELSAIMSASAGTARYKERSKHR